MDWSDPYLTFQIKDDPDSFKRSKTCNITVNPIWNETFEFQIKEWNTAVLVVNLWDEDLKHDAKMMNELELPLIQWPVGTHAILSEDIKLRRRNAGTLFIGIDVLK